jgi:hypothetical protein
MSFKLVNSETVPLTLERATQFHNMDASPTERDCNRARVKHLRDKAEGGKLVTFHWSVANYNGKQVRMNGQHSSVMLCELNGAFPSGLYAHIDTYDVANKEDLADLFRQFDDRKSSRSPGDVAGAHQGLYEEVRGVDKTAAKLAVEGVAWFIRVVEGAPNRGEVPLSGDGQYGLFGDEDLYPFVNFVGDLFSVKTKELKRVPVVAAMYAAFIHNAPETRAFYDKVARGGVEFDDTAPATVLDRWLVEATAQEARAKLKLKPGNFYQGCIYAWNAYREEKPIKDIRSDSKKGFLPVVG